MRSLGSFSVGVAVCLGLSLGCSHPSVDESAGGSGIGGDSGGSGAGDAASTTSGASGASHAGGSGGQNTGGSGGQNTGGSGGQNTGGSGGQNAGGSGGQNTGGSGGQNTGGSGGQNTGGSGGEDASSTSSSGSTSTGMDGPTSPTFDWTLIIGTGQSLSVGVASTPISHTQPFHNLKLVDSGTDPKFPIDALDLSRFSVAPLTEPIRVAVPGTGPGYGDEQYPNNIHGESPHSSLASQLSSMWERHAFTTGELVTAHTVVGWSGHPLSDINPTGTGRAYAASLSEARRFEALASDAGKTFGAGAVVVTHGESDANNLAYGAGLEALYGSYDSDIKAITGQTEDLLMLVSQQSSIVSGPLGSAVQVFELGKVNPGRIVCVGPKYAYEYAPDLVHLPAGGYVRLGQKYAEVYDKIKHQHIDWKPVGPSSAVRVNDEITLMFDVPTPPLVWDENISPPHQMLHTAWRNGRGFEVVGPSSLEVEIEDVQIHGNQIVIKLSNPPPASTPLEVRYAITQDGSGLQGGTDSGMRGQLRDSNEIEAFDDESVDVRVVNGSAIITSDVPSGFRRRAGRDRVLGAGVAPSTIVRSVGSPDVIVLSTPWTGATGTVALRFERDLYNYAVHFSLPVAH